jgi:hypothetical protein
MWTGVIKGVLPEVGLSLTAQAPSHSPKEAEIETLT